MLQNVGPVSTLENLNACKLRLEHIYIKNKKKKTPKHFILPWQMQLHPLVKIKPK